jgi:hypothetical protein
MNEELYTIIVENTEVAKHVPFEYACIFVKAIMREYYNEPDIRVTIKREPDLSC